jgi:hypothetical protein
VRTKLLICRLAFAFSAHGSAVSAQSSASQAPTREWQVALVPYLWAMAFDGQVGVLNRTADVDASFANILDHLHFAAMGMADAQAHCST